MMEAHPSSRQYRSFFYLFVKTTLWKETLPFSYGNKIVTQNHTFWPLWVSMVLPVQFSPFPVRKITAALVVAFFYPAFTNLSYTLSHCVVHIVALGSALLSLGKTACNVTQLSRRKVWTLRRKLRLRHEPATLENHYFYLSFCLLHCISFVWQRISLIPAQESALCIESIVSGKLKRFLCHETWENVL